LIVAVCGIGGAPSCGSHQLRGEYPLHSLTQTLVRHRNSDGVADEEILMYASTSGSGPPEPTNRCGQWQRRALTQADVLPYE